jgi:hypothetical protein
MQNAFGFAEREHVGCTAQLARTLFAMGAAFLLASCATTSEIASDYDRSTNFATYRTFVFLKQEHRGIPNPLVAIRAEEEITHDLQLAGYTLTSDATNADFTVEFTIGSQERTDINTYPAAYAGPLLLSGPAWSSNIDVRQYREGTLAIDVFDGRTHRPVWHGWVQKELTRKELEQSAEPISKAVSSVLAKFPPGRDSSCRHRPGQECVS